MSFPETSLLIESSNTSNNSRNRKKSQTGIKQNIEHFLTRIGTCITCSNSSNSKRNRTSQIELAAATPATTTANYLYDDEVDDGQNYYVRQRSPAPIIKNKVRK